MRIPHVNVSHDRRMLWDLKALDQSFDHLVRERQPATSKAICMCGKYDILRGSAAIKQPVSHRVVRVCLVDSLILQQDNMHRTPWDVGSAEEPRLVPLSHYEVTDRLKIAGMCCPQTRVHQLVDHFIGNFLVGPVPDGTPLVKDGIECLDVPLAQLPGREPGQVDFLFALTYFSETHKF